jgi:hypothetical protein
MDSESTESIRDVPAAQIPLLAHGRGAGVLTRTHRRHWKMLIDVGDSSPDSPQQRTKQLCFPTIVRRTRNCALRAASHRSPIINEAF